MGESEDVLKRFQSLQVGLQQELKYHTTLEEIRGMLDTILAASHATPLGTTHDTPTGTTQGVIDQMTIEDLIRSAPNAMDHTTTENGHHDVLRDRIEANGHEIGAT